MNYYDAIISEKTNDKTDLYLMIDDDRITSGVAIYKDEFPDIDTPIRLVATNLVSPFRELDFPVAGCPEVVSEDLKTLITDLGDHDNIEFLPAYVDNVEVKKKYYVLKFLKTESDLVDLDRSKYLMVGEKKELVVPFFKKGVEVKYHIFKVDEIKYWLFVSEKFKKEFKKRKLIGCDFYKRTF